VGFAVGSRLDLGRDSDYGFNISGTTISAGYNSLNTRVG
jgi:hypothetical protein